MDECTSTALENMFAVTLKYTQTLFLTDLHFVGAGNCYEASPSDAKFYLNDRKRLLVVRGTKSHFVTGPEVGVGKKSIVTVSKFIKVKVEVNIFFCYRPGMESCSYSTLLAP